jgi:hypothetical protein
MLQEYVKNVQPEFMERFVQKAPAQVCEALGFAWAHARARVSYHILSQRNCSCYCTFWYRIEFSWSGVIMASLTGCGDLLQ